MKTKNIMQYSDKEVIISIKIRTDGSFRSRSDMIFYQQKKTYNKINKDKIAQKAKLHYLANKEFILLYHKQYYLDNQERSKEYSKQWARNNIEKSRYIKRTWAHNNPDKIQAKGCKEKAIRKGWGEPIILNNWFEGSDLHHLHPEINHHYCIYIPSELHRTFRHRYTNQESMDKINREIVKWINSPEYKAIYYERL